MSNPQHPSKFIHYILWILQAVLAAMLLWAAFMKLLKPVAEISTMWPWAGQVSAGFVKFTGIIDLLGAVGLVFPALLRIRPWLTPLAATGIVLLMIAASIFHVSRGEASLIGFNIVVAAIAAFIAWGRYVNAPIVAV